MKSKQTKGFETECINPQSIDEEDNTNLEDKWLGDSIYQHGIKTGTFTKRIWKPLKWV